MFALIVLENSLYLFVDTVDKMQLCFALFWLVWTLWIREILDDVGLHPCLCRSSRCLGLQDKHNTQRGLQRKWSRASPWWWSTADLPMCSSAANDVSLHTGYPLHTSLWRTGGYTFGNWSWGNIIEQFALYTSVLEEGCRKQTALQCLGAEYAKFTKSLNNLDILATSLLELCII